MSTRRTDAGHTFDHGAQYFTARDPAFRSAVEAWVAAGVVAEWPAVIGTLRGGAFVAEDRNKKRYVGVPGNDAPCLQMADKFDVRQGVAVGQAKRTNNGWRLVDAGGEPLGDFDWFVTTAPAPQSAELLAEAPRLATQATSARMTGCYAVMAAFDGSLDLACSGAFVDDSILSWIANDTTKPGRPSIGNTERWVLHASPEWSEANINLDPPTATEKIMNAFWRAAGLSPRPTVYERAHRWRYALPPEPLAEPCLFDAEQRLGACGDWCGGPRVEGAFLSGAALAERLLAVST